MRLKIKTYQHLLFNLLILFVFLLPNNIYSYLICYGLFFSCILNYNTKLNYLSSLKIFLLVSLFFSFIYNLDGIFVLNDFLKIFNILILIFLFPYFDLKFNIDYRTILFITLIILTSQLSFIFNLTFISNLIEQVYKIDPEYNFTRFIDGGRNGGIYYNPNQASKYITMLIALVFISINNNTLRRIILIGLYFSLFITGSRTGFIIGLVIFLTEIFFVRKRGVLGIITTSLVTIMYIVYYNFFRSLNFEYSGSLGYKVEVLIQYLDKVTLDNHLGSFLFGNFTSVYELIDRKYNLSYIHQFGFDSEIGMLISSFGILAFIIFIMFYIKVFKELKGRYILIICLFIFWPITSTILFSIKTSMLFYIILGWSVNKSKNLVLQ